MDTAALDGPYRSGTEGSGSSKSSSSSSWSWKSSKSSRSGSSPFKTKKVKSFKQQAIEREQAARPETYQWKCSTYNLTWEVVENYLRRRFPNLTFQEFQSGDYWIFEAPEAQTVKDHSDFAKLRPKSQALRRSRTPE